ncbi:hypothetical protein LY90DRAFT_678342 [Neocallimastix californiae]|uniref:MSP domain-containing protein n=1 Tax=Neocallimastix californiae TaxID=1754190 RepID=A0A1Y1Z990_9FUNG|nr:hypothetical protein LY90DRAFT_678342 [Neocallimastix californiae]|eukprot:ORY06684.1 hypothetical protein LY90DRAFT_678342 [Neocallimastix californiae]
MTETENIEEQSSLIELVNVNSKFTLEKVYLNNLHALKRVKIKNISKYPILVKLRSNLSNQITFQLNNENLENENEFLNSVLNDQSNNTTEPYNTNISLFSPINSYSDNEIVGHNFELKIKESTYSTSLLNNMNHTTANAVYNQQFNQLFNYVGQIDEVQIEPGQTVPVIVEFLPENKEKINMQDIEAVNSDRNDTFLNSYNDEDANYNFFEINGLLFFIAYRLDTILQKQQQVDLPITITDKSKESNSDNQENIINNSIISKEDLDDPNKNNMILEEINNITSNIPSDQQITLKFRSKVCKSVLWIDIGETGISFDDCVLGGTYFKDFTLWNRSEIDLYWIMSITDTLGNSHVNWLKFFNYDTGEELDCKPLSAFAHLRIRVQFCPQEIGEFSYDFQIENANDMSNIEETKITSVVRAVKREESLVVSSGNILDFGDCCAGVWTRQQLILRNVSDVPLDITFQGVDAEVQFKIKIDDLNGENKDNNNNLVRPFPLTAREDSFLSSSRSIHSDINKLASFSNEIPNSPMSSTMVSPSTTTTNFMDGVSTSSFNVTTLGLYNNQNMNEYSVQNSEVNSRVSSPNMDNNVNSTLNNTSVVRNDKRSQSDVLDYIKWTEKINEERRSTLQSTYDNEPQTEFDEGEKSNDYIQTEEIILNPRNEKTVLVYYRPEQKELTANYNAGRLTKQTFKIILHYSSSLMQQKEKKKITCRARSCTSFIEVQPKVVNFGDTNVGTLRSLPIKIYNRSELINCIRGPYEIPPRQSLEVKIDIYPRKVNPDYRKQITVVNHLNKNNNQTIEVQSTNIDKHGVTFHSLFYRIITSNSTNFIDLGDVILNSPVIRTFSIINISKKPLILLLTASLKEIGIYTENTEKLKNTNQKPESVITTERRKKMLESMADKRRLYAQWKSKSHRIIQNHINDNATFKRRFSEESSLLSRTDYLDLATLPNTFNSNNSNSNGISNVLSSSLNSTSSSLIHVNEMMNSKDYSNTGNDNENNGPGKLNKNSKSSGRKKHHHQKHKHSRQCSSTSSASSTKSLSITSLESLERDVLRKRRSRTMSKSKSRSRSGSRNKTTGVSESISFSKLVDAKLSSKNKYLVSNQPHKKPKKIRKNHNKLREFDDFSVVASKKGNKILEKNNSFKDFNDSGSEFERFIEKANSSHKFRRNTSSLNINSKIDDNKDRYSSNENNEISGTEQYGIHNNSLKRYNDFEDEVDNIKMILSGLISAFESNNNNLNPVLPKSSMEEDYVRSRMILRNELDYIMNSNYLCPISKIEIPPQSEKRIILIYMPSSQNKPFIQRKPRKQDAKIFIKLVDFDRDIPRPQFETLLKSDIKNIPVRELMIRFSLCRSVMDLGQKNINFGMLSKGDSKTKTIIIHNRSEASLLYNIKKSGSIASSDLVFSKGKMGIVSGYSTREVTFVFEPSLPGQFHEKLVIENINDRENNQILSVKANIRKTSNFSVETSKLDFGNCVIDELCLNTQNVIIKSTCTKQKRYLEIFYNEPEEVKFSKYKLEFEFEDEDELYETDRLDGNEKVKRHKPVILTKEIEEEIEHLEQKLKIAQRKGRSEKIKKMQMKIEQLKSELNGRIDVIPKGTVKEIFGNFMIIEHRNTDTLKKLPFTANLYFDKNASVLESNLNVLNESFINSGSITNMVGDSKEQKSTALIENNNVSSNSQVFGNIVAEPESLEEIVNNLIVEVTSIDLGKIEINDEKDCYFTLTNNSDKTIKYNISQGNCDLLLSESVKDKELINSDSNKEAIFEIDSVSGEIKGNESIRIDLTLISFKHGRNESTIYVKEDNEKSQKIEITFQYYSRNESYLVFPDLDENALFDMKNCFVDYTKKYSKVTPFHVKNIYEKDLYVNCTSNLSQQCLIFTNENLEQPAQNVLIKKDETIVVYIALQPNLGINRLINKPNEDNNDNDIEDSFGLCRTLIGGLRFSISIKENENDEELFQLLTQTVKFTTYIGQSLFMLSESLINFGITRKVNEEFISSFSITNLVPTLPLEYIIECSSNNIILNEKKGVIEAITPTKSEESKLTLNEKKKIKFKFRHKGYGFINEYITVKNINNALQVSKINLRLFVDKNVLKVNRVNNLSISSMKGINDLNNPVRKKSQSLPQFESQYEYPIEIENTSSYEMVIIPRSDLDLDTRWSIMGKDVTMGNSPVTPIEDNLKENNIWNVCGLEVRIKPNQKFILYVSVPRPTRLCSTEEINVLNDGKSIDLNGALLLYDKNQQLDVMAFNLTAFYCMSISHINETEIDVGKIGNANLWQDVPLSFEIKNDSIAPLFIPGYGTETIEMKIKPHDIKNYEVGYKTFYIKVINKYNPENEMSVKVDAELTEYELHFERLNKGELFLPPLYHPYNAEALPCDNWFTILNSSDHEVKFEMGVLLDHEISKYVNVEVLSRFSNSPVVGTVTLAAHNSIEIKVRAYSREDSRLDNEKCKDLINVDGISFGNLWIITHQTLKSFPYQSALMSSLSETDLTSLGMKEKLRDEVIIDDSNMYIESNKNLIFNLKTIIEQNKDILNDPNNRQIIEGVPLKGKIIEGQTFSISNNRIEFGSLVYSDSGNSDHENSGDEDAVSTTIQNIKKKVMKLKKMDIQRETFVITNLSKVFPLKFRIEVEYPIELMSRKDIIRLSPLDENMGGIIEPNGKLPITVEMLNSNIQGVSEDVKIHIYDDNSLTKTPINVYIGIIEESSNVIVPEEANDLIDIEDEEYIEISQQPPEEGSGFKHKKIKSISEDMNEKKMLGNESNNDNVAATGNINEEVEEIEDSMDNKSSVNTNLYTNEDDLGTNTNNTNLDEEDDTWLSDIISVSSVQSIGDRSAISTSLSNNPYGNINLLNRNDDESVRKYNSHMMVRGCQKITDAITGKEVKRFYLLNFGQQDLGSTRICKKITLENISFEQVSYKITTVCDHLDKNWIFLSRYEGILDFPRTTSGAPASGVNSNGAVRRESHTITININSAVRGYYSTYIIIRNLYNPLDFKIIKVHVEIVAKHNLQRIINPSATPSSFHMFQSNSSLNLEENNLGLVRSNRVFDVYVNGVEAERTCLQLENLFYGRESTARSIVIYNRENVPLEFTIKSSMNQNSSFEIIFSLSRTSVKLYSVLTIQPLSSVRVYIRFRPDLPEDAPAKKNITLEESNVAVKEEAEIYINCRLVKDYQLTIPLKAMIRMPQIYIPIKEFVFKGKISKKNTNNSPINSSKLGNGANPYSFIDGMIATSSPALNQNKNDDDPWNIALKPVSTNIITVYNVLGDDLELIVMNDSIYFDVEIVSINDKSSSSSIINSLSSFSSEMTNATNEKGKENRETAASDEGNQDLIHDLSRINDSNKNNFAMSTTPTATTTTTTINPNPNPNPSTNNQMIVYIIPAGGFCNLRIIPKIDSLMRDINSVRRDKYLQEHLTIYNRKRPTEKVWIVLKLSFGNIIDFQSSSVQKSSYKALECRIIRLLREINRYVESIKCSTKEVNSGSSIANLYFKYHYIVDQLIYYGTREHSGDESFHLAILVFTAIFFYPTFGESITINNSKWISTFSHFLNFFPYNSKYIDILRGLFMTLKNSNSTVTTPSVITTAVTNLNIHSINGPNIITNTTTNTTTSSNPMNSNGTPSGNNTNTITLTS